MRLLPLIFALIISAASSAHADKRVALVIGNGAYRNVTQLSNPRNDADDIAASFKRLNFSVSKVIDGTFDDMRRALLQFGREAIGADMAVIYYSGHGMEMGGENWLIPIDAELQSDRDAETEAIALKTAMLQSANGSSLGLVILDACRNNPFAVKMQRSARYRAVDRGLVRVEPSDNVLVAYAAREGTIASDGAGQHSPFTAALLNNLETPGLEINFLFRNVRDEVMTATKHEQQPFVYGSLSKQAIYLKEPLASPTEAGPPSNQLLQTEAERAWTLIQGSANQAVLEDFVRRYGDSFYSTLARVRLDELKKDQVGVEPPSSAPPTGVQSRPQGIQRAWFGVKVQSVTNEIADRLNLKKPARGALVVSVEGPAKVAGIERDDLIVSFDGKAINEMRDLVNLVANTPFDRDVEVLLLRGGKEEKKMVRLARADEAQSILLECNRLAGLPGAIDASKAIPVCRQAVDLSPNDPKLIYQLGRANLVDKNYTESLRLYRQAADLGYAAGMSNLGWMYANGRGVAEDDAEAVRWYRKAADAGDANGMARLGGMYLFGTGVAKDEAEAIRWYRKAADAGHVIGMVNLGWMYANGRGVAKDEAEAVRWYQKAADAGEVHGMNYLGAVYANGRGVAKDEAEAVRWYRKAADAGEVNGMNNLGTMYRDGRGVAKDEAEAVRWYRKAADAGHVNGMVNLGWMYESGTGVAKDDAEAARWFRKAADAGGAYGMNNLGVMYRDGRGLAKDDAEAVRWFRMAADAGEVNGMGNLGTMYRDGRGVAKNEGEAVRWYRKAADAGYAIGMVNLGWMYENGRGVTKDYAQAREWYEKAEAAGNMNAKAGLERLSELERQKGKKK